MLKPSKKGWHKVTVLNLVRNDLRDFTGYASARKTGLEGDIWLNANESPWPALSDTGLNLNRYPQQQPIALRVRMAELYTVSAEQLFITRGSDEGIDLLMRSFCRAGQDGVVICPPTFGMYAVCARLQATNVYEASMLDAGDHWQLDKNKLLKLFAQQSVKIVFICSPANPTGQAVPISTIKEILKKINGRALLVVDEAYIEYSDQLSISTLLSDFDCLVVLRTLSKAYALAAARLGAVLAHPTVIKLLSAVAPPYPIPSPTAELALAALSDDSIKMLHQRMASIKLERQQLMNHLSELSNVLSVYPSDANFLLVRFQNCQHVFERLLHAGIVVRDMRSNPILHNALRISIGTSEENTILRQVLLEVCSESKV